VIRRPLALRKRDVSELRPSSDTAPSSQMQRNDEVSCPYCDSVECYRSERHGWQDFSRRLLGMFPWRCKECRYRFYLRKRHLA
jgi:DNA-directed RNA polymerase subunit RPC12/RpoP